MIRIQQLKLPIRHTKEELEEKIGKTLRIPASSIVSYEIAKQSIDARKKDNLLYTYTIDVHVKEKEDRLIRQAKNRNVAKAEEGRYHFPEPGEKPLASPPVIIGMGPAGLFCGLMLAPWMSARRRWKDSGRAESWIRTATYSSAKEEPEHFQTEN